MKIKLTDHIILSLVLALSMLLSLTGCTSGARDEGPKEGTPVVSEEEDIMYQITTDGIRIEAKGDTLFMSNIPNKPEYKYGIFSLRRSWWKMENQDFPDGVWKEVTDGQASYCLRDRGEGEHEVFISFVAEKKLYPEFTVIHIYKVNITEDNVVTIGEKIN